MLSQTSAPADTRAAACVDATCRWRALALALIALHAHNHAIWGRERETFLALAGHEFKTPVAVVRAGDDLALRLEGDVHAEVADA